MSDFTQQSPGVAQAKADLRATVLSARRSRPSAEDDQWVRVALTELARGLRTVAGYVPLPGEPGGPGLPDALARVCERLLLPVLLPDRDLDWAVYAGDLVPAGRGLREPAGPRLGVRAIAEAQLVIVPALAVDRRGVRLGRGGGSYDRALPRVAEHALVIAPLYDAELLDEVPAAAHDRRIGAVLTPTGGVRRL